MCVCGGGGGLVIMLWQEFFIITKLETNLWRGLDRDNQDKRSAFLSKRLKSLTILLSVTTHQSSSSSSSSSSLSILSRSQTSPQNTKQQQSTAVKFNEIISINEDNIKTHLENEGWKYWFLFHVAQDNDQWRAVVNTVMNLRVANSDVFAIVHLRIHFFWDVTLR